jgi:hypothetical protein
MKKYYLTTKITKDTKGSDNLNSDLRDLRVLLRKYRYRYDLGAETE